MKNLLLLGLSLISGYGVYQLCKTGFFASEKLWRKKNFPEFFCAEILKLFIFLAARIFKPYFFTMNRKKWRSKNGWGKKRNGLIFGQNHQKVA